MPGWIPKLDEATHDRLDGLRVLAAECSASPAEDAMAWVLSQPQVAATILGWRNQEQMNSAVRAVDLQIPAGHLPRIDVLFPPPAPVGDERILQWRQNGWKLENTEP